MKIVVDAMPAMKMDCLFAVYTYKQYTCNVTGRECILENETCDYLQETKSDKEATK